MANNTTNRTSNTTMPRKKSRRRMKKQVRRTIAGLFMASAIAVAAIPVEDINADNGLTQTAHNVKVDSNAGEHGETYDYNYVYLGTTKKSELYKTAGSKSYYSDYSGIPFCDPTKTTIYSTGDGDFQFAYVDSSGNQDGGGTKTAIILGYDHQGQLDGGILTIPDTVDAYLNFNDNDGSNSGQCAVGKSGNFLFYNSSNSVGTKASNYYYIEKNAAYETVDGTLDGELYYEVFMWDFTKSPAPDWSDTRSNKISNSTYLEWQNNPEIYGYNRPPESTETSGMFYKVQTIPADVYHNFKPCYYKDFDAWNGKTLYYYPTDNYKPDGTPLSSDTDDGYGNIIPQLADDNDSTFGRISGALVTAIGNQSVKSDGAKGWVIDSQITDATKNGVFSGNGYISHLEIGGNLTGIGDYAFYNCANMSSISTGNGLNTLGNHAFDNCRNMTNVNIPTACNLYKIGAYCFNNCQSLIDFTLPTTVVTVGDGAFKNCHDIQNINLKSEGKGGLQEIGQFVFMDCTSLRNLTFPDDFTQELEISEFEGCKSLEYIKCANTLFDIIPSKTCDYDWNAFKLDALEGHEDIKEKFYLESLDSSKLHTTATENEVSFKFLDQEKYEVTKKEIALPAGGGDHDITTVTYQVNNNNELTYTKFNGPAVTLNFPAYIGPYHIASIGDGAFRDQCSLCEIRIPSTIESIGREAFAGCHNLKYVYFDNDQVIIGENAFKTQEVGVHNGTTCKTGTAKVTTPFPKEYKTYAASAMTDSDNKPVVELGFIGKIDENSNPYNYAMSYAGRYNNGAQGTSYIKYFSGWPTMLTVQFNETDTVAHTGYSELVYFPTRDNLSTLAHSDYLTKDQQDAADNAIEHIADPDNVVITDDGLTFENAASTLTVPTGIDAIKDGLFHDLTDSITPASFKMNVVLYGIDTIEGPVLAKNADGTYKYDTSNDDQDLTGKLIVESTDHEDWGDFYNCPRLGTITLAGNNKTIDDYAFAQCKGLETVIANCPIDNIGEEAFSYATTSSDFPALKTIDFEQAVGNIEDHAFDDQVALETVVFKNDVGNLELRPWSGCTKLTDVYFAPGDDYLTDNSIVYKLDSSGVPYKVIEVLEGRKAKIPASTNELTTVTELAEEAFMGAPVTSIDLTNTPVGRIPVHAFADTTNLYSVSLPSAQKASDLSLDAKVFENSTVKEITGNANIAKIGIDPDSLVGIKTSSGPTDIAGCTNNNKVTIYAPNGSGLYSYGTTYKYTVEEYKEPVFYEVTFRDWDEASGKLVTLDSYKNIPVEEGKAVPSEFVPIPSGRAGYIVDPDEPWIVDSANENTTIDEVWGKTTFTPNYVTAPIGYGKCEITFWYYDPINDPDETTAIKLDFVQQFVEAGDKIPKKPTAQDFPEFEGFSFDKWTPSTEVTISDEDVKNGEKKFYASFLPGYVVTFQYMDPVTYLMVPYDEVRVPVGGDASIKVRDPRIDGYTFVKWVVPEGKDLTNVTSNITATGTFKSGSDSPDGYVDVEYYVDGTLYMTVPVKIGGDGSALNAPAKQGYTFTGWSPVPNPVMEKMKVTALYSPSGSPTPTPTPTPTGNNNKSNNNNNNKSNNNDSKKTYTVTVINGSGSGTYEAGSTVIIAANTPPSGKEFKDWTTSDVSLASTSLSATTFKMPDKNVTVTANYKDSPAGTQVRNATGNSIRPAATGYSAVGNTSVQVTKPGVSNVNLASATVRGSNDSFIVRVTETNEATNAVVNALNNRYGSLDGLKYWACDISLYDATGTTKITDTTGLQVDITLPIPDELREYGGNNKAGAVANYQLEDLKTKFNTVNGTPTVTFTATHFSPYVIYADTNNLDASQMMDASPKTGDPIHPKWFLALGLAAASIVLFLKKDKRVVVATT